MNWYMDEDEVIVVMPHNAQLRTLELDKGARECVAGTRKKQIETLKQSNGKGGAKK